MLARKINAATQINRYDEQRAILDAKRIYRRVFAGELATIGRANCKVQDYPFSSVAPLAIDHCGCPLIYVANIAEHTKNVRENSKASLLLRQIERQHRIETGWRLTCVGDLQEIVEQQDKQRVSEHYFRHYPKAKKYGNGFSFFRLHLKQLRLIMGFGKVSWIAGAQLMQASIFSAAEENAIIAASNDNRDNNKKYLQQLGVTIKDAVKAPRMVAVNQFGATLEYCQHFYFFEFAAVASDLETLKQQLRAV